MPSYWPIGGGSGSGQPQTPWAQNINGAGFALTNAGTISVAGALRSGSQLTVNGPAAGGAPAIISEVAATGQQAALQLISGTGPGWAVYADGSNNLDFAPIGNPTPSVQFGANGVGIGIVPATSNYSCVIHAATNLNLGVAANTVQNGASLQAINDAQAAFVPMSLYSSVFSLMGGNVGIGIASAGSLLTLSADSAAKPSTNTWTISSDIRTKRNVRRFEGDIEVIRKLEPIVAEYNGLAGTPKGQRVVSFDAAELRKLVPPCVSSVKAKLRDGDEEETEVLGVNTHELFFHLLRAVQDIDRRLQGIEHGSKRK